MKYFIAKICPSALLNLGKFLLLIPRFLCQYAVLCHGPLDLFLELLLLFYVYLGEGVEDFDAAGVQVMELSLSSQVRLDLASQLLPHAQVFSFLRRACLALLFFVEFLVSALVSLVEPGEEFFFCGDVCKVVFWGQMLGGLLFYGRMTS